MREGGGEATADRIGHDGKHNRNCPCLASKCAGHGSGLTEDCVGSQIDQLFCEGPDPIRFTGAPAKFDPEIAAFRPTQLRERAPERRDLRLRGRIAFRKGHQHADQPYPVRLLCPGSEWPRYRSTAEQRDELATPHSITSSARASNCAG